MRGPAVAGNGYAARVGFTWVRSSRCADHTCVEVAFVKSTHSATNCTCVEVGHDGADVLVRDSKDPDGPVLRFTAAEWTAFLDGAASGEFGATTGGVA